MEFPINCFYIFTENNIISREIKQLDRCVFYSLSKKMVDAFFDKKITKSFEEFIVSLLEMVSPKSLELVKKNSNDEFEEYIEKPRDEIIFELPSYRERVNNIFEFIDESAKKYGKLFSVQEMLNRYIFKFISNEKFNSKFIKLEDQLALIDIKNIVSDNKNGISFITTLENHDYLKDNISKIIEQFLSSNLKILNVYSLIRKPIEEAKGMVEKSSTRFILEVNGRVMNLITYPSTNISIVVMEVT